MIFGMGFIGLLFMVLFWNGFIATIFPAINRHTTTAQPLSTAEILKMRYTRGEITADEYKKIQETIEWR